jgi:uncharacterized protein (DUF488 family)
MISWPGIQVHTIGHSSRSVDDLVELLRAFHISTVVDVRTIPRSLHNPQFGRDRLRAALRARRLRYAHVPELGGLRKPLKISPNMGWRNASFRGFADYMMTEEFEAGLQKLQDMAIGAHTALMCAEAVPWRCHRSLIADALVARGASVEHIISSLVRTTPHRLTSFAVVDGSRVSYPTDEGGAPGKRSVGCGR